jgi:glycosyltransferase involved in cell wall biosynthesis
MKIGILGTRGIPNAYGGFEQFASFLAEGLVARGHEVFVYNSSAHPYQAEIWQGVRIIHRKDPENKLGSFGQFIYDFNCLADARKRTFDIVLHLGYTSSSVWHWLWPKHAINITNMDGLEWKRTKYSKLTRHFLKRAEYWAAKNSDRLIADSRGIQEYLHQKYQKASVYIPYGARVFDHPDQSVMNEWSLAPKNYCLLIARMEPENNIGMIIEGYLQSGLTMPLMIVGNIQNKYGSRLRKKYLQKQIVFSEGIYDQIKLNNLRYFAYLYFHGHSVGGTNPSLLEAMACSCKIIAHSNPFNRAILEDKALYFEQADGVAVAIKASLVHYGTMEENALFNLQKIISTYNWPTIVDQYEHQFHVEFQAKKSAQLAK